VTTASLKGLPKRVARSLIRSLQTGTSVLEGIKYLHVGHDGWLKAQQELLNELAEDQDSDVVFIRGSYGAGKTHFLGCVQDNALGGNWATSHIECRRDHVELDRFHTVYPRIIHKLRTAEMLSDIAEKGLDPGTLDGGRWLLDKWASSMLNKAGFSPGPVRRTMEVDERLCNLLQKQVMETNLLGDFRRALFAYARATLLGNTTIRNELTEWFKGEERRVAVPATLIQPQSAGVVSRNGSQQAAPLTLFPIGRATSLEALRGLLWLLRTSGFSGLVLCIDEIEEIAKLSPKKRQDQSFQVLREFVDNSDGALGIRQLCTYFAATPEMFESEHYFRRYDALATRIEPVGNEINWRSPVVDLDRTPLTASQYGEISGKVREIYGLAYGWDATQSVTDDVLDSILDSVLRSRYRIAKPRLLCRVLVDELERARSLGNAYVGKRDPDTLVRKAAEKLQTEADS
jgi:hypothetical protein